MRVLTFDGLSERKGITYSREHIRRLVKDGKFPNPIRIGTRSIAWDEAEIDAWLAKGAAARDTKPAAA